MPYTIAWLKKGTPRLILRMLWNRFSRRVVLGIGLFIQPGINGWMRFCVDFVDSRETRCQIRD